MSLPAHTATHTDADVSLPAHAATHTDADLHVSDAEPATAASVEPATAATVEPATATAASAEPEPIADDGDSLDLAAHTPGVGQR